MSITHYIPPPRQDPPPNALAGPVPPQLPSVPWNGLAIVGQAPGRQESINQVPFTGPAGDLLDQILARIGIAREACFVMNPFLWQPCWTPMDNGTRKDNDIMQFFTNDISRANTAIHDGATHRGQYVRASNVADLRYAWSVLARITPRAILAMGATALWFTTGEDRIGEKRGQILKTPIVPDVPVVPTFHPASALHRNSDQETIETIMEDCKLVLPYLA
jgi:uracil-DNA glycosylase